MSMPATPAPESHSCTSAPALALAASLPRSDREALRASSGGSSGPSSVRMPGKALSLETAPSLRPLFGDPLSHFAFTLVPAAALIPATRDLTATAADTPRVQQGQKLPGRRIGPPPEQIYGTTCEAQEVRGGPSRARRGGRLYRRTRSVSRSEQAQERSPYYITLAFRAGPPQPHRSVVRLEGEA